MYKNVKRFFDFLFSLVMILVISPLLIPIMIGLKLTGEGYIFYLQERVGYKNQLFDILKFATMLKDSPNMEGGSITMRRDPRITSMGGFLRKTKINELPQLFNVLLGKMSFVGPRPLMKEASFDHYPEDVKAVIYNVPPGITGVGSVIFRGEDELIAKAKDQGHDPETFYRQEIYPYKGKVEKWYQANQTFMLDFFILFCTGWVIIFPDSDLLYKMYPSIPEKPASLNL